MHDLRVALFFTRSISLRRWDEIGMFDREVAIYRHLQKLGVHVSFLTYGDSSELSYTARLPGVRILCNRWGLPDHLYARALPILHNSSLRQADLYKTNQANGAEVALRCARFFRKPLVARCGYMWSYFAEQQHGAGTAAARLAVEAEERVFTAADRIVVTTDAMQREVIRRVHAAANRTVVIPNYVDTSVFRPYDIEHDESQIVFVGRLALQKNVAALLEAIEPLEVELSIIGDGQLRQDMHKRFGSIGGRVSWLGNVPNHELPAHLARASLFVLPSHYEGQPKTLIEAMACGLAVIGADSPGIRELIRHGETGWLCGTDSDSIRAAIQELVARPQLRAKLGKNACRWVQERFALDRVAEMELALLREVSGP